MKYELWDVVSMGEGEPLQPLTRLFESDDFMEVFAEFEREYNDNNRACVVVCNKEKIDPKYFTGEKIYESDGESIYERTILSAERKKIK